ncbi:AAA family ATPase [Pseudomonas lactis]|uniref:AAA family ATPase n=1 Tax=Pseudomonas lactis TaxID=1615674 RepID=A0A7Y1Q1W3_9PSED|nr:AAA family ATPase [Pseudomonas lactis]NNA46734.1 AAA family ATPase [Pseudomonas lactis]
MEAQKPKAWIRTITFSSGQRLDFSEQEKVIIVGPNNSGKSQSLRDIIELIKDSSAPKVVINDLDIEKVGSKDDLIKFLAPHTSEDGQAYRYGNWNFHTSQVHNWERPRLYDSLAPGFIKNISANDRLTICNSPSSITPGQEKSRPQHVLYEDDTLMAKVSALFKRAFKADLMIDFKGGSVIPIHVGITPTGPEMADRASQAYAQAVRSNPPLDRQGDGMRGYAGILFETLVTDLDMMLVDEPEAFLHPPQMRKLGETLASEVKGQLFVSTHSSDILRGFLEGTKGEIRIIRITRNGKTNEIHEAKADVIRELWQKPDLRYSNALEGIFHEQTIICEDDSDCRLINSIADYCGSISDENWKDTSYIPTGGKHAIPKIASTLRKIGLSLKTVVDIDFLSEERLVKETVEAFGGDWEDFKTDWKVVDSEVRKGLKSKSAQDIKSDIEKIISTASPEHLPTSDIKESLKQVSPWNEVKKYGASRIPRGDGTKRYLDLDKKLKNIGIYVISKGEIEGFCPGISGHGPKFVTSVLNTYSLDADELNEVRTFVNMVHSGNGSKHGPILIPTPAEIA